MWRSVQRDEKGKEESVILLVLVVSGSSIRKGSGNLEAHRGESFNELAPNLVPFLLRRNSLNTNTTYDDDDETSIITPGHPYSYFMSMLYCLPSTRQCRNEKVNIEVV